MLREWPSAARNSRSIVLVRPIINNRVEAADFARASPRPRAGIWLRATDSRQSQPGRSRDCLRPFTPSAQESGLSLSRRPRNTPMALRSFKSPSEIAARDLIEASGSLSSTSSRWTRAAVSEPSSRATRMRCAPSPSESAAPRAAMSSPAGAGLVFPMADVSSDSANQLSPSFPGTLPALRRFCSQFHREIAG